MNEYVSKPCGVRPHFVGMQAPKLFGEAAARLANNLEVMQNPYTDQFLFVERLPAAARVFFNLLDGIPDVFEAKAVVPHSGTASRRTVARTRLRKPREDTTSTFDASKLSNSR